MLHNRSSCVELGCHNKGMGDSYFVEQVAYLPVVVVPSLVDNRQVVA
jgi:hypothetical protein